LPTGEPSEVQCISILLSLLKHLAVPYGGYFTWTQPNGDPIAIAPINPMAQLTMTDDRATVLRSLGNTQFDYRLHFFPDLRANLNLGYDISSSSGFVKRPENYSGGFDRINGGGTFREYDQEKKNTLLDFI
jgi:TonB-dependent starch-binding outer membrane protein SusC